MSGTYNIIRGSIHDEFFNSRAKIRVFGGGFGNGKTAAACILALRLARDYPGSNGLIARATFPKLNDTIRKEFVKWCPKNWIKSFPMSDNASNTCTLVNGTTVNFRYVQQKGKTAEATTSNLLSATYDWIIVDQMEDPEIMHKDFLDLLGRLRGMAVYSGKDITMPSTGPRWMILTVNPTSNWFYRQIVRPLLRYKETNIRTPELLWEEENDRPLIELFEGPTHINAANLEDDFIKTLESTYKGQMRERYLLGKWGAFEGLVYPDWNPTVQLVPYEQMLDWMMRQTQDYSRVPTIIEGYDYGLAQPACYGFAFVDLDGNVNFLDGFYEKELAIKDQAAKINQIRKEYFNLLPRFDYNKEIFADPSIFKRLAGRKVVGESIANIFETDEKNPIVMRRGNNDIQNGIVKVSSFLIPRKGHRSPYTGNAPAPLLYVSDRCSWLDDEFSAYMWKKDTSGDADDVPVDKNDHGMDMIKFALSERPVAAQILIPRPSFVQQVQRWHELEQKSMHGNARYA